MRIQRVALLATAACAAALLSAEAYAGTAASSADGAAAVPAAITAVMHRPRYARAGWNLLVTDLATGKTVYALHPDTLAFTGSVRKLFSVGLALDALGADHRFVTPVYRRGTVAAGGILHGDLILAASGDLTFGGRETASGDIAYTNFDHNDANSLGTAILTPQDPLRALDALARQVRAGGLRAIDGDVVVDDRLFVPYRVPNGNLLVTPMMLNENLVDVWLSPARLGSPARLEWRPKTPAFSVAGRVTTAPAGSAADVTLSNDGRMACRWPAPCVGTVAGKIPLGYAAPLSGSSQFVRTFRVEDPASFARIAFVAALARAGVSVRGAARAPNAAGKLPPRAWYSSAPRVAQYVSPPYAQDAKLVLKVSLNLGANVSLSLFGLTKGERTIAGSLAAERRELRAMGIPGEFDFPTNGSGSPDSRAAARATVALLTAMSKGRNAATFRAALPILGVDGSLAETGRSLPARGHVFAKTGTTVDRTGLKAQTLAGYIDARDGKHLAFALYVNDAGPIHGIADVTSVFDDEAAIVNAIYERN
ncbi:MAG TPA: D-alanyl-D-alanine carboxypeptidase [Candidatus Tumulicola sp.]|nr:D-alanyl-D-alanine carboxypeptidase [Candidatus Tumulicola sp.]